jgi:hypothetical protein
VLALLAGTAGCADSVDVIDPLAYAEFAREQFEARVEGLEYEHVFLLEARFLLGSDAVRSVDVDYAPAYRAWEPSSDEREELLGQGWRFCPLVVSEDTVMHCDAYRTESPSVLIALGLPEHLGASNYRLPFTWAARSPTGFHSGAGAVDVQRREENGIRWVLLRFDRWWIDH